MDQDENVNQAMGQVEINETAPKSGKVGPTIGIIIIIILILLGGLYYLKSARQSAADKIRSAATEKVSAKSQELLDKVGNLESKLNSVNLDEVDTEAGSINTELSK